MTVVQCLWCFGDGRTGETKGQQRRGLRGVSVEKHLRLRGSEVREEDLPEGWERRIADGEWSKVEGSGAVKTEESQDVALHEAGLLLF